MQTNERRLSWKRAPGIQTVLFLTRLTIWAAALAGSLSPFSSPLAWTSPSITFSEWSETRSHIQLDLIVNRILSYNWLSSSIIVCETLPRDFDGQQLKLELETSGNGHIRRVFPPKSIRPEDELS